ncbi:MAG: hypothetical protein PHW60_14465 [Kiritimatiellae bacterium]|nr:hypothetical protein [Kiritimatiellia bacterium]
MERVICPDQPLKAPMPILNNIIGTTVGNCRPIASGALVPLVSKTAEKNKKTNRKEHKDRIENWLSIDKNTAFSFVFHAFFVVGLRA